MLLARSRWDLGKDHVLLARSNRMALSTGPTAAVMFQRQQPMILANATGATADRAALSDAVSSRSRAERQQAFNRSQLARDAIYVRRFQDGFA